MSGGQGSSMAVENYRSEKHSTKLWRKMKEAPFVPVGIGGLIGAVGYGIWGYRNRGKMSTSVYVMHFRVIAQGMVVGAITIGVGINIGIKLWERYHPETPTEK
ncbi:HIG1 domain family member 1A, mitochondrial-like [Babylonia areolata]|uniref:HIG1 domain family member 1A, mitochondrial-like n=1 Tax=Babylonia areolata TaxID=304850 RepID=UPI003FD4D093